MDGEAIGLGDIDHLLLVRGDRQTGRIDALVALYKHLQVVVHLGATDLSAYSQDIRLSYRVDQVALTHRHNDARDGAVPVPQFQGGPLDPSEIIRRLERPMSDLHAFVQQQRDQEWQRQIVNAAIADYVQNTPLPETVTQEYIDGLIERIMNRLREEWARSEAAQASGIPVIVPIEQAPEPITDPTIALLESWLAEAPTDQEAIRGAEEDLREFKRNMNLPRKEAGARLHYPEVE